MVVEDVEWINERHQVGNSSATMKWMWQLKRTQGQGIVEHFRIKCSTIQYGPLVEQRDSIHRVEKICSTSSVKVAQGLSTSEVVKSPTIIGTKRFSPVEFGIVR